MVLDTGTKWEYGDSIPFTPSKVWFDYHYHTSKMLLIGYSEKKNLCYCYKSYWRNWLPRLELYGTIVVNFPYISEREGSGWINGNEFLCSCWADFPKQACHWHESGRRNRVSNNRARQHIKTALGFFRIYVPVLRPAGESG